MRGQIIQREHVYSSTRTRWLTFRSIPFISGVFFLVTVLFIFVSPRPTSVDRILRVLPMQLFTWVIRIVSLIFSPVRLEKRNSRHHLVDPEAAQPGNLLGGTQFTQAVHGRLDQVMRIVRP